jgi:serine/threonine protein kinase
LPSCDQSTLRPLDSDCGLLPPPPPGQAPPLVLDAAGGGSNQGPDPFAAGPPGLPGYEILDILGRGGMGVVYKARQVKLDRLVALKMILAGSHASADDVTRFRREAEAVARLQHPHIVQIYEVGEHQCLPYISLEYCDGGNLAAKAGGTPLPARQAAQLVEMVARAVHAAHQRGIVHRDLKPANILLQMQNAECRMQNDTPGPDSLFCILHSAFCIPKVTDFGLAKRLDDGAAQTATGAVVGTPSYMAPEQAEGKKETIGPATDVYALGAVLYELLTGRPPFNAETYYDTLRQVVDEQPVSPRLLQPKTPRDLETICLKCLAKSPPRRYATAQALADDLARFRRDEPITARPAGRLERLGRWCRRNPKVAGLLAALAIVLAAGSAAVTALWLLAEERRETAEQSLARAERQQKRAEAHLQKARAAVDKLTRVADEWLRHVPHMDRLRRQVLEQSLQLDQQFLEENSDDPAVRRETARTHARVGVIHQSLGNWQQAENHYRQAVAGFRKLALEFPNEPGFRHDLARYLGNLGMLLGPTQPRRAGAAFQEVRDLAQALVARFPKVAPYRESLAKVHFEMGVFQSKDRPAEAESAYRRALRLQEALVATDPGNPDYHDRLAATCRALAMQIMWRGELLPAQKLTERATRHELRALRIVPRNKAYQQFLAAQYQLMAAILKRQQNHAQAEATYRKARAVLERLVADFPAMPDHPSNLGAVLNDLAIVQLIQHKLSEARQSIEQAIRHQTAAVTMNSTNPRYKQFLRNHYWNLADILLEQGEYAAAAKAAARLPKMFPKRSQEYSDAAWFHADCAEQAARDAKLPENERRALAAKYAAQTRQFLTQAGASGKSDPAALRSLAWYLVTLPPPFRNPARAVRLTEAAVKKSPRDGFCWGSLGAARYRVGDWQGSVTAIEKALQLLSGGDSSNWFFLAMAHHRLGAEQQARTWFSKATRWMDRMQPHNRTLRRLRAEAAALLDIR